MKKTENQRNIKDIVLFLEDIKHMLPPQFYMEWLETEYFDYHGILIEVYFNHQDGSDLAEQFKHGELCAGALIPLRSEDPIGINCDYDDMEFSNEYTFDSIKMNINEAVKTMPLVHNN